MSAKPLPTDLPILTFTTADKLRAYLHENHAKVPGFHLQLAKKACAIPSVTASEAIEVALCYGWIDGRSNGLDGNWWLVRYTPRRPRSIWSLKNVNTVERLTDEGLMQPSGIAAVEAAKADGRWERAYAGPATIEISDDFEAALNAEPNAKAFFETLNKTDRYSVLWRIQTAPVSTRSKRIGLLVNMLGEKRRPRDAVASVQRDSRQSDKTTKPRKTSPTPKSQTKPIRSTSAISKDTTTRRGASAQRIGTRMRSTRRARDNGECEPDAVN